AFLNLHDWDQRKAADLQSQAVAGAATGIGKAYDDAMIFAVTPPPITGMSTTGGFEGYVQSRAGGTSAELGEKLQAFIDAATARPEIAGIQTTFNTGVPRFRAEVDREKARAMGVEVDAIFET